MLADELVRLQEQQRDGSPWRVTYRVGNSFQNELERSLVNDLGVLNIASVCIIAYTYLAISRPRDGAVGSRLLLTLSGMRFPFRTLLQKCRICSCSLNIMRVYTDHARNACES